MEKLKALIKLLEILYNKGFYGELNIKFEAGIPVAVKKLENIKL